MGNFTRLLENAPCCWMEELHARPARNGWGPTKISAEYIFLLGYRCSEMEPVIIFMTRPDRFHLCHCLKLSVYVLAELSECGLESYLK